MLIFLGDATLAHQALLPLIGWYNKNMVQTPQKQNNIYNFPSFFFLLISSSDKLLSTFFSSSVACFRSVLSEKGPRSLEN